MKTNLNKILAVSGQSGLFTFLAQSRTGAIVESLVDKKRMSVTMHNRITALSDVSIYTDEGEMKLKDVFLALSASLEGAEAPSSKADNQTIVALFEKAVPTYDRDRFYLSHMKKVLDWYNCLVKYASLDFEEEEGGEE
ncbi:MAG: DUF5606 domain-containing protein [Bacteroidales bacterium]|jgi:hypothetical protein|nr:DUF5606 domain-containing protein [Bacteroidales bacterium]